MSAENFHWERLPEGEISRLLEAYQGNQVGDVLRILNTYRVGDGTLTICCGIGEAWQAIDNQITQGWTTTRGNTQK